MEVPSEGLYCMGVILGSCLFAYNSIISPMPRESNTPSEEDSIIMLGVVGRIM